MLTSFRPVFGSSQVQLRHTTKAVTPFGGLVSFIEFMNRLGLAAKLQDLMPFTLSSPNAIPPAQTLMAFLCSVMSGPVVSLTPTGCALTRPCTPCLVFPGFRALTRFSTSLPASAKGLSKRSGVLSGVGFCLFSVSRWRGLAWIWIRRSSSAAEGRRVPPKATTRNEKDVKVITRFYRQPATLRAAVFLGGAILGRAARKAVLHLSSAWGGLDKHKPMLEAILRWQPPTSPKLDSSEPTGHTFCAT